MEVMKSELVIIAISELYEEKKVRDTGSSATSLPEVGGTGR